MFDYSIFVAQAEVENGANPLLVSSRFGVPVSTLTAVTINYNPSQKAARWNTYEDDFLRQNLGILTEEQMAEYLGRSTNAIHLRWERDLDLPSPSHNPAYYTANQVSHILGLSSVHPVMHWCKVGLIKNRVMAGGRYIRLILRSDLTAWVVNPDNWIYISWRKITDPHLRRLCELRQQRWNDEWLSSPEAAEIVEGITVNNIARLAKRGTLPAVQPKFSRGGRASDDGRTWSDWYVRKSDLLKTVFYKGKGSTTKLQFSDRAEDWMLRATLAGLGPTAVWRTMGGQRKWARATVAHHIRMYVIPKTRGEE